MPNEPIFDEKPWWASKGVIGALGTIISGVLMGLGVTFDIEPIVETLQTWTAAGAVTLSGLLALVGRVLADRRVVLWPKDSSSS